MQRISVKDKEYPCYVTMGALLRFKDVTGKELSEVSQTGLSDMLTLLWCCCQSACRREGMDFDLSLADFADNILPDELLSWSNSMASGTDGSSSEEKKRH